VVGISPNEATDGRNSQEMEAIEMAETLGIWKQWQSTKAKKIRARP